MKKQFDSIPAKINGKETVVNVVADHRGVTLFNISMKYLLERDRLKYAVKEENSRSFLSFTRKKYTLLLKTDSVRAALYFYRKIPSELLDVIRRSN